ncbi:MAG TPA: hypothetical protein DCE42_27235, partial [Myxococcales bacterium]|nr:hypothetical protein [Myxococcales bacterium]
SKYAFLWIDEFPLVEETEDENGEKHLHMLHHPFTQPHPEDIDKIETAPAEIRSISYDLVLNGYELGSGSLRVFDTELQTRLLKMVGIEQEEAEERFGFFLEALKYGTPPHGGMGLGLDRIIMILAGSDTLRDVIAFPKTQKAACPMSEAPGSVDQQQLDDIHIALAKKDKAEE